MNGKYLLDTNIIIALFKDDRCVTRRIVKVQEIFICTTVIGELFYGLYRSSRKKSNERIIEDFILSNTVVENNLTTSKIYGRIKSQLKKKGNPIPENDIWIAAHAIQYDLNLATRDKHFESIEDLSTEIWD